MSLRRGNKKDYLLDSNGELSEELVRMYLRMMRNPSHFANNFIMDYVLKFGAWALQPKNLEVIIAYVVCILFLIGIGFLSVYLAGFGSEYQ